MSERASIHQAVQVGIDTTAGGNAVAARHRLTGASIELSPKAEVQQFKAGGSKAVTTTAKGKEWAEGSLNGVPSYNEMLLFLVSNFGASEVTEIGGGAYRHVLRSEAYGPDSATSFTVEQGSDVRAHRATAMRVTDLTMSWNRPSGSQELTGSLVGRALTDNVVMTANAEALPLVPITAEHVTLYLDGSEATLGTTALSRAFSVEIAHTGRFSPVWALNSGEGSFVTQVESDPTLQISVVLEANAQGMGLLYALRDGTTRWLRVQAAGPELADTNYSFRFDAPCRVTEVTDFSDQDGVYAIGFTLTPIYDEDFGGSHEITVVNDVATLS